MKHFNLSRYSKNRHNAAYTSTISTLPYDIVHEYTEGSWVMRKDYADSNIEFAWDSLPYINNSCNSIVIADGSSSMTSKIVNNLDITALDVANALSIYYAENNRGIYKNKSINFSNKPKVIDFNKCKTLRDKIKLILSYGEVSNINIEAVFGLILETAVKHRAKWSDLPSNIIIITDMDYNNATINDEIIMAPDKQTFFNIYKRYISEGYFMPHLVFWNISSNSGATSIKENDFGITFINGFSYDIYNTVLNGKFESKANLAKFLL